MSEPTTEPGIAGLSYEEAREQLIAVVGRLEAGGASLGESVALGGSGEAPAARGEERVGGAPERAGAPPGQPL